MSALTSDDTLRRAQARGLLLCTGAGVSVASGVPSFRGPEPDAVWSADVMTLGTRGFFDQDPAASWSFYLRRFDGLRNAQPNAAHQAITRLEQQFASRFLLVTQNVDTLHEQAGTRGLIKVHGSSDRARCSRYRCSLGSPRGELPLTSIDFTEFRRSSSIESVPKCPECRALLRPHVLWFDERYDEHKSYGIEQVLRRAKQAGVVIFVGTSFAVGVTEMILDRAVSRGALVFSIDPSGRKPRPAVKVVTERAEEALPGLVDAWASRT